MLGTAAGGHSAAGCSRACSQDAAVPGISGLVRQEATPSAPSVRHMALRRVPPGSAASCRLGHLPHGSHAKHRQHRQCSRWRGLTVCSSSSLAADAAPDAGARQRPVVPVVPAWLQSLPSNVPKVLPLLNLERLAAPATWAALLCYILFMLILPITALLYKASQIPLAVFVARATEPVAMSAYAVTFSLGLGAALFNAVFGFLLAWVLVKYRFPGKKWIDAAVDLPFALPTSVAGLTLLTVYSDEGVVGALLAGIGLPVAFTQLGVAVAMVFVSFPFVVRTMQPVLQEMEKEVEEAAWSLGASPWRTFRDVVFPPLMPPLLTGTALAFSRAIGEFGSVVVISSNFPFKDLVAPVLIFQCLEQYDYTGATVIGTVLLLISLVIMVAVNWLQSLAQAYRKV